MFSTLLIDWYKKNKRDLPWRDTINPYFIWLSEVILQQTRVAQGLPYYFRFIQKYPDINSLAIDTEENVLSLWAGLGYYSRGRNLHKTAKFLVDKYEGTFPCTYADLLKLNGVGPYTAAAIASFAYKEKVPVVDGNVLRVIARFYTITEPVNSPKTHQTIREVCNGLIPSHNPDLFNQAIMELGALVCSPKKPSCDICPMQTDCGSYHLKMQHTIPIKIKKNKSKERNIEYLILLWNQKVYLNKRTKKDIWLNLYDFLEIEKNQDLEETLRANFNLSPVSYEIGKTYFKKHILTHQKLSITFQVIEIKTLESKYQPLFMDLDTLLPKPIVVQNILEEIT